MEIVDLSEANLDGDFLALKAEREKKRRGSLEDTLIFSFLKRCSLTERPAGVVEMTKEGSAESKKNRKLREELFSAVDEDNSEKVETAMKNIALRGGSFVETDYKNEAGLNALHHALQEKKKVVARYLLSKCSVEVLMQDIEVKEKGVTSHKSNLHILTEEGEIELTRQLLNRLDETPLKRCYMERMVLMEVEGQRPRHLSCLHIASMLGHTRLVDLFRRSGMKVNFTNNKKDTPILWAARNNHVDTARYLIAQGADLNVGNDKGSTPLYWAARYGFPEMLEVLVKEGKADVNQKRKLGFYYPIILAAALGYLEIVRILFENGADPFVQVNNNLTALHVASAEGYYEIVQYLLEKCHLNVHQTDTNGNTALLFAAFGSKVRTIMVLVQNGADLNVQNKMGQSVWEFALNHPNEQFLTCTLLLYKQFTKSENSSRLISFPRGKSPLHIAASKGNVKKLNCLINQGVDPHLKDANGNSFLHLAAKENMSEVLEEFIELASNTEINNENETALHVAARHGNLEATLILLRKFKLETRNKEGMTPLHVSVLSDKANPKLVRRLVEHIVKTSTWSLVDAVDNLGNTALHIACKRNYPEIIAELCLLNPKVKNKDGDSPFHIAAFNPNTAVFVAMMETFNKPENGVDFNETNAFGESCLHICARKSDSISLITLISNGADLSLQNLNGNTVIHVLIEESVEDIHKTEAMIQEYRNVKNMAALWWSMQRNQQFPSEGTEAYDEMMRRAMLHLTTDLYNNDGHDSINYAIHLKATDFLREILNTPKVYKLNKHNMNLYDVTYVMPGVPRRSGKHKVADVESNFENKKGSYLNSVVLLADEMTAAQMLDLIPLNEISSNYWRNYQWIYMGLLCVHLAYMILFTIFVMPTPLISSPPTAFSNSSDQFDTRTLSLQYRNDNTSNFGWFILWPAIILLFECYYLAARCYYFLSSFIRQNKRPSQRPPENSSNVVFFFLSSVLKICVTNLDNALTLTFCAVTIAWYIMLHKNVYFNDYLIIVSLVFLFGWTYLINFTKAIESLHVFSIMLKYIILHDITRFLALYVIFLLGCGMAFFTLFQIHPDVVYGSSSISNTFYNAINAMLGLEPLFPGDFDETYSMYGGKIVFIKAIYILYILAATVILMNLLIAMMTDTYTNTQAKEVSTWKVGSLKLALKMEEVFPLLCKAFEALCMNKNHLQYDFDFERWMMPIRGERISRKEQEEEGSQHKVTRRIENKVEQLYTLVEELSIRTEALTKKLQELSFEKTLNNSTNRFRNIAQLIALSKDNKVLK